VGDQDVPRIAPDIAVVRPALAWHCLRLLWCLALALPGLGVAASLRSEGVLTVAVYRDFAPFSQDSDGDWGGVDVKLARALAKRLDLGFKLLPFDAGENMADDLRNMVWRGDILHYGPADVMMHVPVDARFAAANDQALIFAPYYRESLVLVHDARRLPTVREAADLVGEFVGAEQGTAAASALLGAGGGALREKVKIAASPAAAMQLLFGGQTAAVLVTRAQAELALRTVANRTDYKLSRLTLNGIPPAGWVVGMAVKAENRDLAAQLEAALEQMRGSGELRAIFEDAGLTLASP